MLRSIARRGLIDQGPEHTNLFDRSNTLKKFDRLHHIGVDAKLIATFQILRFTRRCQDHNRDHLQILICFDLSENLQSIYLWHLEIKQDHNRVFLGLVCEAPSSVEVVERLNAIPCNQYIICQVVFTESADGEFHIFWVIFHEQDSLDLFHITSLPSLGWKNKMLRHDLFALRPRSCRRDD